MNKKLILTLAAGALFGLQQTYALPITGTIRMSGDVTLDTQDLQTATSASFVNPAATVTSGTDSYAGTAGSSVDWNDFGFDPSTAPVDDLWSFVFGGSTYTFDLDSITDVERDTLPSGADFLLISGLGTVAISGGLYTPTHANWSFTITDTSGGTSGSFVFGFADSNTAIPDGGATAMLLGLGVLGMATLRRKLG